MKLRYLSQENELYNSNIRRYGCYFLSILRIIEEINCLAFSYKDVEEYYTKFLREGFILSNCSVVNPDSIFSFFGIRVITSKRDKEYRLKKTDFLYFVAKIKTNFFTGHFILCKSEISKELTVKSKFWDSLFLLRNNHSLCSDAFRIFSKV